jgi:predicted transcriptional regulator
LEVFDDCPRPITVSDLFTRLKQSRPTQSSSQNAIKTFLDELVRKNFLMAIFDPWSVAVKYEWSRDHGVLTMMVRCINPACMDHQPFAKDIAQDAILNNSSLGLSYKNLKYFIAAEGYCGRCTRVNNDKK